jgi:hypothetical protein
VIRGERGRRWWGVRGHRRGGSWCPGERGGSGDWGGSYCGKDGLEEEDGTDKGGHKSEG